ncbi:alpha/beta hydrolase [candidate division KSB1 bacterium]|nr:alpha/beta hydrolase [candidate division KSB1 bacterium]
MLKLIYVAIMLLVICSSMIFLTRVMQKRLIYFPEKKYVVSPASIGLSYETIQFKTSDDVLITGWFVAASDSSPVVLFFHGNAGNISHRLEQIRLYHSLGLSTFIIDYRGYGESEGTPSENGTYQDAEAAWKYLIDTRGIEPTHIILAGRSLGGAVAAWLAQQVQPHILILESTFTSLDAVAKVHYSLLPISLILSIHYPTLDRLPSINCPVLFIHSRDDEVIPFSHGKQLYETYTGVKEFLELRGGHNDGFYQIRHQYAATLSEFLNKHNQKG